MGLSPEDSAAVEDYFKRWNAWLQDSSLPNGKWKKDWRRTEPVPSPITAFQAAALHHPNARVRRECLGLLDHYANDESASTFAAALSDPVARVRNLALHGLSCERCRTGDLAVEDVVPALLSALASDPSPKVRHNTLFILAGVAGRDRRVRPALNRAAREDDDNLVRYVAQAALDGRVRDMGTRKALRRRANRAGYGTDPRTGANRTL
jgi:HEAT repeat protein